MTSLGIAAAVVTVLGGVFAFMKWGREGFAKLRRRRTPPWPQVTLRFVPKPPTFRWNHGTTGGKPAMQIIGHWQATAVTSETVFVARAYLHQRRTEHDLAVLVLTSDKAVEASHWPIAKGSPWSTVELQVMGFVTPRPIERGPFKTTIVFVDSLGNEYHEKATFPFVGPE